MCIIYMSLFKIMFHLVGMLMNKKAVQTLYDDLIANNCVLDSRCMGVVNNMITLSPDGTPGETPTANPITEDANNNY